MEPAANTPVPNDSRWFTSRRVGILGLALMIVVAMGLAWNLWHPSTLSLMRAAGKEIDAGRGASAVESLRIVVARDPESAEGWRLMTQAGILADDRTVWEPAIAQVERMNPAMALDLWVKFGSHEMRNMKAASAEHALRRATEISRDSPEAWRLLAQLISIQGRPRETVECLLALIRLGDFSDEDLHNLAWPNSAVNDPERIKSLLAGDAANLIPMLSYVGAALNENRAADAERYLVRITKHHPRSSRAVALMGLMLAQRDAPEFVAWQRDQSAHADNEPETWIARGLWLRNHDQASAAAKSFRRAVEMDPRHLQALSELGQMMNALGEQSLAAEILDAARRHQEITELSKRIKERGEPESMKTLFQQLERAGRLWEAWAWCRLYQRAFPADVEVGQELARLKQRLKPDLPRTIAEAVPGRDFDWKKLNDPDWSAGQPTSVGNDKGTESTTLLEFEDDALRLGIEFHFENGPTPGGTIVQTSGGGVAAFDYDRDGWCDLYFTQGGANPAAPHQEVIDSLFRNLAGRGFQNVTNSSAIHEDRFSQGVAAGDFDNDGFPDLYVANLGSNRLLRNNGDGTFSDVTETSGLTATGWTTSCAIADVNNDGHPELFSIRYAGGPEIAKRVCRDQTGRPGVCRPTLFPAETDLVAVSTGDGRFREECGAVGMDLPDGRGFGLIVAHFNEDKRLDVFVANDQTANFMLMQQEGGSDHLSFADEAIVSAMAFDRDGYPQACMGIAATDLNEDGRPDLFITNFADESDTLYVSQPHGGYLDMTREARLRDASFHPLGFGTQFLDADLDGRPELIVLNGHILDGTEVGKPPAMLPQLYRGLSRGRFAEVRFVEPKAFFNTPRVGRGLCVLDWNRDGRPDFVGSFLDGNAALGTNRCESNSHWLEIEFVGVASSRDAIGTRVALTLADGSVRRWQLMAGDGFAASNERRLHLGLGSASSAKTVVIEWPSGLNQRFDDVKVDTSWLAIEGRSQLQDVSVSQLKGPEPQ